MKLLGFKMFALMTTFLVVGSLCAQPLASPAEAGNLMVTINKTTSVIFPAAILSVDRGSRDILAQKANGVENILQLKAARQEFPETNLTVITTDGKIHQFTVNYAHQPDHLMVNATTSNLTIIEPPIIYETTCTDTELNTITEYIKAQRKRNRITQRKFKISMSLDGFFIYQDIMFARVSLENKSHIPYDADFFRLYFNDKKKVNRTATQEVDVFPIQTRGDSQHIPAQQKQEVIFVLNKFTIPDDRRLILELFEKNGGRHLRLQIKNKTIVNAQPVPQAR